MQHTRHLSELLAGLGCSQLSALGDCQITGIAMDWREIGSGYLFVARHNYFGNTHADVVHALERGAGACLVSENLQDTEAVLRAFPQACLFFTPHEDPSLGEVCARFYGHPTQSVPVFGVTGTNGKTTTCALLYFWLQKAGMRPAMMLTTGMYYANEHMPSTNTTPDALFLQRFAAQMLERGADCLIYECSSHALEIGRVHGIAFNHVGLSNLSHEHLDFHQNMGAYALAKSHLFNRYLHCAENLGQKTSVTINMDDAWGRWILAQSSPKALRYVVSASTCQCALADVSVRLRTLAGLGLDGVILDFLCGSTTCTFQSPLLGEFNTANVGLAVGMLLASGLDLVPILCELVHFVPPAGRMQRVFAQEFPRAVFIDYAHTPEALGHALAALHSLCSGPITLVFGAGGQRDKTKRPQMAAVAQKYAHTVILTNDNPRGEDPERIMDDISAGFNVHSPMPQLYRIADRAQAIRFALSVLDAGPVLIAGKGHETTQEIGTKKLAFSDCEAIGRALRGQ